MNILRETIFGMPFDMQLALVVAVSSTILYVTKLKSSNNNDEDEKNNKEMKEKILNEISIHLDTLNYLTSKVIADREVIGVFNTETLILSLKSVKNLEKSIENFHLLNDAELHKLVQEYTESVNDALSTTYKIENEIYKKQKEAEQVVIAYNREFDSLVKSYDNEDLADLKKQFQAEIREYKEKVRELTEEYSNSRDSLANNLEKINQINNELIFKLTGKESRHSTSKVGVRELVYA